MRSAFRWFQGAEDRDEQHWDSCRGATATDPGAVAPCDHASAGASTTNPGSSDLAACFSAAATSAAFVPFSTPASAHADSPASLIHSTASLTQSPSPQPETPPDVSLLRPSKSPGFAQPISIVPTGRDEVPSSSLNCGFPSVFSDDDLADMTTGALDRGRHDSFVSAGPKPITMNNQNRDSVNRNRRESLAGSLMGGVSWGGMSFGSFVRDE